jgi:DNA-binding transcriptional LysR family regulator
MAAARELGGSDARLSGTVRLTASDVDHLLIPRLGTLRRAHPELEIVINVDPRHVDLSRREADVALRLSRPKEPALVARRLGTLHFRLFASATYLERRRAPRSMTDLASHEWIGFDVGVDLPQTRWLAKAVGDRRHSVRVNTTAASVAACAAGHGIALLPTFAATGLRSVLPKLAPPTREVWAVMHRDVRRMARVGIVTEWLTHAFDPR